MNISKVKWESSLPIKTSSVGVAPMTETSITEVTESEDSKKVTGNQSNISGIIHVQEYKKEENKNLKDETIPETKFKQENPRYLSLFQNLPQVFVLIGRKWKDLEVKGC